VSCVPTNTLGEPHTGSGVCIAVLRLGRGWQTSYRRFCRRFHLHVRVVHSCLVILSIHSCITIHLQSKLTLNFTWRSVFSGQFPVVEVGHAGKCQMGARGRVLERRMLGRCCVCSRFCDLTFRLETCVYLVPVLSTHHRQLPLLVVPRTCAPEPTQLLRFTRGEQSMGSSRHEVWQRPLSGTTSADVS